MNYNQIEIEISRKSVWAMWHQRRAKDLEALAEKYTQQAADHREDAFQLLRDARETVEACDLADEAASNMYEAIKDDLNSEG